MNRQRWLSLLVLVLVAAGAAVWAMRPASPNWVYRTETLRAGAIEASVSASGTVAPVAQVTVGSQVSGLVRRVAVDFNDTVTRGQLLAEIDPESFEQRLRSARADLLAAQAAVRGAQASAAAARADLARSLTERAEAERTHRRNLDLVARAFVSPSEGERSAAQLQLALDGVVGAQARLDVALAQVDSAQAAVRQREAAVAQADVDLARTRILSPEDGIVIKRAVEAGQTVAASLQAPELFVIARNLSDMQVEVSVDEADVARLREGQNATFTADALPDRRFDGTVAQVRKAARTESNVVTYTAVVRFANDAQAGLLPGMTANVRVVTAQRPMALQVPNAALRLRLPEGYPAPPEPATQAGAVVYLRQGEALQATPVRLGLSDGRSTELLDPPPELKEGVEVVTSVRDTKQRGASGPRLPF